MNEMKLYFKKLEKTELCQTVLIDFCTFTHLFLNDNITTGIYTQCCRLNCVPVINSHIFRCTPTILDESRRFQIAHNSFIFTVCRLK